MRTFSHVATLLKSKRLAHHKKYSQSELSKLLGYKNGQFISNIERGLCSVPLKNLKHLCDILDINKSELKQAMVSDYESTLDSYLAKAEVPRLEETSPSTFA